MRIVSSEETGHQDNKFVSRPLTCFGNFRRKCRRILQCHQYILKSSLWYKMPNSNSNIIAGCLYTHTSLNKFCPGMSRDISCKSNKCGLRTFHCGWFRCSQKTNNSRMMENIENPNASTIYQFV